MTRRLTLIRLAGLLAGVTLLGACTTGLAPAVPHSTVQATASRTSPDASATGSVSPTLPAPDSTRA